MLWGSVGTHRTAGWGLSRRWRQSLELLCQQLSGMTVPTWRRDQAVLVPHKSMGSRVTVSPLVCHDPLVGGCCLPSLGNKIWDDSHHMKITGPPYSHMHMWGYVAARSHVGPGLGTCCLNLHC